MSQVRVLHILGWHLLGRVRGQELSAVLRAAMGSVGRRKTRRPQSCLRERSKRIFSGIAGDDFLNQGRFALHENSGSRMRPRTYLAATPAMVPQCVWP